MSILHSLEIGSHRLTCPACGRGPKDRTCGVTVEHDGSGVAHCFRCEYVETYRGERSMQRLGGPVAPTSPPIRYESLSEFGRALWDACRQIGGDGLSYLKARHCVIPPTDGDLRYHPALKHPPSGKVGPALVALVTDAVTRDPISLHRTWIKADGSKAAVDPPRLLLGGHRKKGGVIRLWPDECVNYGLGIGEGIESALTLARVLRPAWSCIDAGNLAQLPVLGGIEVLTIAADNDTAGLKAAHKCAVRWVQSGVIVRIVVAPTKGADLNDFARRVAA